MILSHCRLFWSTHFTVRNNAWLEKSVSVNAAEFNRKFVYSIQAGQYARHHVKTLWKSYEFSLYNGPGGLSCNVGVCTMMH